MVRWSDGHIAKVTTSGSGSCKHRKPGTNGRSLNVGSLPGRCRLPGGTAEQLNIATRSIAVPPGRRHLPRSCIFEKCYTTYHRLNVARWAIRTGVAQQAAVRTSPLRHGAHFALTSNTIRLSYIVKLRSSGC